MNTINENNQGFSLMGHDLFGVPVVQRGGPLSEKFTISPFSVLSARDGAWQERKRAWASMGIRGEIGRDARSFNIQEWSKLKSDVSVPNTDTLETPPHAAYVGGMSIFDPVLCELSYKWFCPDGGQIVDPFAGGSVRGVVAGLMGYSYYGIDLRREQIEANETQRSEICPDAQVEWDCGDSMDLMSAAPDADFIFSCPPYGDLERYSDDPSDLSTMEYHTFIAAYKRIILRCAEKLKPGAMACFVVGDFRDKKTGNYRGFVADTIYAFRECGLELYNDAILVTAVGSLPIRVSAQFEKSRKLGKTHQNILVFKKPT